MFEIEMEKGEKDKEMPFLSLKDAFFMAGRCLLFAQKVPSFPLFERSKNVFGGSIILFRTFMLWHNAVSVSPSQLAFFL
jgi:hypothetical protein